MSGVLFSPHADDETLFAAYTVLRHRPRVVICFPSERDYGETQVRADESRAAMRLLGVTDVDQWHATGPGDLVDAMKAYRRAWAPSVIWAPHLQASHLQHRTVALAATCVFGQRVRFFHTYDAGGKVRAGELVAHEPGWPELKQQALACYRTQREHPRARQFFEWDLLEYAEAAR